MVDLRTVLDGHVSNGSLPGTVAAIVRGDEVEVAVVGSVEVEGTAPMARDSIFRVASITKLVAAATVLMLIEDGRIALDDPVNRWLPELAAPMVVRTPSSPLEDVVPAERPITVFDLLTSQAGYGFASDFTLPAVQRLFSVQRDGRRPHDFPAADAWMAELSRVPLLYQPGRSWLYDTCSTLQGVLISRVCGQPLPDVLGERVFAPLGMTDSGFEVPKARRDRFTTFYKTDPAGTLHVADRPDGEWSTPPAFPLANGGLAGTLDDWLAFMRMLLGEGLTAAGRRVLSPNSVRLMATDHTYSSRREIGRLFLQGQGWGMGGSVDIAGLDPWNTPGRYGWVGGTGTTAHVIPSTATITILLTQVGADSSTGWSTVPLDQRAPSQEMVLGWRTDGRGGKEWQRSTGPRRSPSISDWSTWVRSISSSMRASTPTAPTSSAPPSAVSSKAPRPR